jgi:hypothetical protein
MVPGTKSHQTPQAVLHGGSPLLTPLAGRHQENDDGDHGEQ